MLSRGFFQLIYWHVEIVAAINRTSKWKTQRTPLYSHIVLSSWTRIICCCDWNPFGPVLFLPKGALGPKFGVFTWKWCLRVSQIRGFAQKPKFWQMLQIKWTFDSTLNELSSAMLRALSKINFGSELIIIHFFNAMKYSICLHQSNRNAINHHQNNEILFFFKLRFREAKKIGTISMLFRENVMMFVNVHARVRPHSIFVSCVLIC